MQPDRTAHGSKRSAVAIQAGSAATGCAIWDVARAVGKVANIASAFVAIIFAHHALAAILSANAGHTNARNAIEGAVRSVVRRRIAAGPARRVANIVGAFILVVAIRTDLACRLRVTARDQRDYAQRADT